MSIPSMQFPGPDIILCDLDNTLYEYEPCHQAAMEKSAHFFETNFSVEKPVFFQEYKKARNKIQALLKGTASSHNRLLYFQYVLESVGRGNNLSLAISLNELYWNTFMDNINIYPGVFGFLENAVRLQIPLALVTDLNADIQFKKFIRFNLGKYFQVIVTSEEAGKDKPELTIFKLALEKIDKPVKTIWMIGDSLEKDILGGKSLGAITFLKVNQKENRDVYSPIKPDCVFESFQELTTLLNKFGN